MRQIPCKMYGSICKLLHRPCTMRGSNSKTRYILHKPRGSLNTFSSVLGVFSQCQNGVWVLSFFQWNSIFFPGLPREGQTPNWHWSPMLPTAPSKKAFKNFKRTKAFIPCALRFQTLFKTAECTFLICSCFRPQQKAGPRRVWMAMANHLKPWTVTSPWNQAAIWL